MCTQQARRGAPEREHQRVRRSVLHRALLANVPEANIHLNKTLESITVGNEAGGIVLTFDDDTEIEADLVIGADGVRSRVRQYAFPEASIKFIGVTAYRALMPLSQVARISSFDHRKTTLWYMPQKGYMYSPIEDNQAGDNKCELVLRELSDPLQLTEAQNIDTPVPNGVEVDNIIVEDTFRVRVYASELLDKRILMDIRNLNQPQRRCYNVSPKEHGSNMPRSQDLHCRLVLRETKSFCLEIQLILCRVRVTNHDSQTLFIDSL